LEAQSYVLRRAATTGLQRPRPAPLGLLRPRPFDARGALGTESEGNERALHSTRKQGEQMATAKKSSDSKGGGKGLSALVTPSKDLTAIVGNDPLPRSEVTKKVWDYIKANGLQDQTNKRMINADDKLRIIFGGKDQVSMFEMTALVNKHLKA
jgi:chromatin remodeling complex protein RSC6